MSREPAPNVRQIAGVTAIDAALRAGADVRLLLVAEDAPAEEVRALVARAEESGASVRTATRNVIARLSNVRPAEDALALVGRDPHADLVASLARGGAVWLLVGVAYPGNVGMVIRTAEVSGADAIAIAQPSPSKLTSRMTPLSIWTYTVSRSPQSGLKPSACRQASRVRKFRGCLLWSTIASR
jgi:tRNA G18 (ribose-2'-O)-methylase SpoU